VANSSGARTDPDDESEGRPWLTEEEIRRYTGSRSIARESQSPAGQHVLTELFGTTPPAQQ
jgi:hypothetical protein